MPILLEFEKEMLENLLEDDCLMITSRGLPLEKVASEFIRTYNVPSNLIFIINASNKETNFIITSLTIGSKAEDYHPRSVTSEYSVKEREKLYLDGGIIFITSRILVVDMLLDRIPLALVTGLLVFKAHKIEDECQEAFILRLFRMKNKTGFIKGFSNWPSALVGGFNRIDRIMRFLFVKKLYLWPRFHASVNLSLESRAKPEVIEIRLSLSEQMKNIQFAIMDLISMCLKEIAKANVSLVVDIDELTAENALSPGFDKYLRKQFDPVWHQLNYRTKKLLDDLKLLAGLLLSLTDDDCITFYKIIKSIRDSIKIDAKVSDWIFWEPAEVLFVSSKERVIDFVQNASDQHIEMNGKWASYVEIVDEINREIRNKESDTHVMIIVNDDRTILKLQDVLDKGPKAVLNEIYIKSRSILGDIIRPEISQREETLEAPTKRRRTIELDPGIVTLTQIVRHYDHYEEETNKTSGQLHLHYHALSEGYLRFEEHLIQFEPEYFILYDPDMGTIRQIEIYQASKMSPDQAKVYFFMFDGSSEEQKYLTSLRREKEAFESLIKAKASMVVPENRDGKTGDNPDLIRQSLCTQEVSTRQAGGQQVDQQPSHQLVIVDMREFRSSLPSLIHKRGIDIEPVTIEIGDYILTPETCVERKSISDLIGSLNNGRLYNQCSAMTRHYKRSIILIEFDQNKSFNFKGKYWGLGSRRSETDNLDVMAKLVLLTLHFPLVRIIWSPSPHFSAEVIEHLKKDKDQPSAEKAISISQEQLPAEHFLDKYDVAAKNLLLNLPGINLYNVYAIMNKVKCFADLVDLSKDDLNQVLHSPTNTNALYDCLHSNLITSCVNDQLELARGVKKSVFKKIKKK